VRIWNFNGSQSTGRGSKDVTLWTSLNGATWALAATCALTEAPKSSTRDFSKIIALDRPQARYLQLRITSNYDDNYTGLAEIEVIPDVPRAGTVFLFR
jgi:hypothetical protein